MKQAPRRTARLYRAVLCAASLLTSTAAFAGDLSGDVRAILQDKVLARGQVSLELVRLNPGAVPSELFAQTPTNPLAPASNLKLVTTSAALDRLGADFHFRTLLLIHDGNLVLIGDGDPTLGDAELLKRAGWDVTTVFKTWARGLAQQNITATPKLLVDDSVFDQQFLNPHWPADQAQKKYMAEVGGLNLNANCLDVYVHPEGKGQIVGFSTDPMTHFVSIRNSCRAGQENSIWLSREPGKNDLILKGEASEANDVPVSVTIHDPPMYAGTCLAESLQEAGIKVGGVERDLTQRTAYAQALAHGGAGWTLLAVHETPLLAVMARANKDSENLYAECCCKRLGFAVGGVGDWPNGTAAVGQFLQRIGVSLDEYSLDDGCGLSRADAISAHLMISVLTHNFASPNAKAFIDTMAIGGVDGTMKDRFRNDLRGRVFAKSGYIRGVSCLSGYLHGRDDRWYAFSILFNNVTLDAKVLEEKIVAAIDNDVAGR